MVVRRPRPAPRPPGLSARRRFTIYDSRFTIHGSYGFEADRHLLHRPVPGGGRLPGRAAVVAALGDGRLGRQLLPRLRGAEGRLAQPTARGRVRVGARRGDGPRPPEPGDGLL